MNYCLWQQEIKPKRSYQCQTVNGLVALAKESGLFPKDSEKLLMIRCIFWKYILFAHLTNMYQASIFAGTIYRYIYTLSPFLLIIIKRGQYKWNELENLPRNVNKMVKNMGKVVSLQWFLHNIRSGQLGVSHWETQVRHKIAFSFMKITVVVFIWH